MCLLGLGSSLLLQSSPTSPAAGKACGAHSEASRFKLPGLLVGPGRTIVLESYDPL